VPATLSFEYPARFQRDEAGRYLVSFPNFPRTHTDGADFAEAMNEAIDCLGSVIAERIAARLPVPVPSAIKRGQRMVPVPHWIASKLALYSVVRERQLSNAALARMLNVGETVVRRLLDPNHETKAEKIHEALEALGKRLVVGMQDAA
jgi:antitoxin HicB